MFFSCNSPSEPEGTIIKNSLVYEIDTYCYDVDVNDNTIVVAASDGGYYKFSYTLDSNGFPLIEEVDSEDNHLSEYENDSIDRVIISDGYYGIIYMLDKYTGGYSRSSVPVRFFWVAMKSFSKEERGELLQYATGTNKAPLDGFDPAFTITLAEGADVENALPTAHTCFNQLVLPEYKSVETLMQKLRYAFKNSSGFQLT